MCHCHSRLAVRVLFTRIDMRLATSPKQAAESAPPLAVQSGPNNLPPTYSYPINDGTAKLVLRILVVTTNNDSALAQLVAEATRDLSVQGSHVWDGQWYYGRLRREENLLLAWKHRVVAWLAAGAEEWEQLVV